MKALAFILICILAISCTATESGNRKPAKIKRIVQTTDLHMVKSTMFIDSLFTVGDTIEINVDGNIAHEHIYSNTQFVIIK